MHSNVIVCWRVLSQPCRDEQRIQTSIVCWRVLRQRRLIMPDAIERQGVLAWLGGADRVRQASERQRVPRDFRQADLVLPQVALSSRRPTSACS